MKILIDACIFSMTQFPQRTELWLNLLPPLINHLREHTIYLLCRQSITSESTTASLKQLLPVSINQLLNTPSFCSIKLLFAPDADLSSFTLQYSYLSNLCEDLDIELFISTAYTVAGLPVKSLIVLEESALSTYKNRLCNQKSIKRCIELASGYVVLSPNPEKLLKKLSLSKPNCFSLSISLQSGSTLSDLDWEYISQEIVSSISGLMIYQATTDAMVRRQNLNVSTREFAKKTFLIAEQNAVKLEIQHQRKLAWEHGWIVRIYRAFMRIHKYPQYVIRLLQLIKLIR